MSFFALVKAVSVAAMVISALQVYGRDGPPGDSGNTSVTAASWALPMAPLGPLNPWPRFHFQIQDVPVHVADDLSAEDRAGTFTNAAVRPLPYLMQDNYAQAPERPVADRSSRERGPAGDLLPVAGRANDLPLQQRERRELLFDNPVFQPANLAIRNAWFSGGVEWNGPLYGHSLLTCSPVFAGRVETPRGPLLRLYEFDRAWRRPGRSTYFCRPATTGSGST